MKQLYCFLVLTAFTQVSTAQEKVVRLKGIVVAQAEEVVGVYVLNKTTSKGTITTKSGSFSIPVRLQDTIEFSAVQFKNRQVVITQKILDSKNYLVDLSETLEELDEVVLDQRTFITAKSLGLPNADVKVLPLSERELFSANNGNNYMSLDPLINFLSGRTKMLKDRISRDKRYALSQELRSSYVDSIFSKKFRYSYRSYR